MIRRKLPQILVFSILVLVVLAAAQPAAAISSFGPAQTDRDLWAEARELFGGILRALGLGTPESDRPSLVLANVGSILDPDGTPSGASHGAGNAPAGETH
ncbi:MAG TPA: hypothetical protein VGS22_03015 [Thermoanaerobaculia bacterium]|jgi:hypothetical protein|nr:hypothetical protein [Thermoanaerobaculia bacterium]